MSQDATLPLTAAELPNDVDLLKQIILRLARELDQTRREFQKVLERLARVKPDLLADGQGLLFDLDPEPSEQTLPTAEMEPEPQSPPRSRPHGRRRLPANLPRERVELDVPEEKRTCSCCGTAMARIGEDISEQLDYKPSSLFVREFARAKYACKQCQDKVLIAPKPPQPIEKGIAGPGLLAEITVSKYYEAMPLHRQERRWARQGVELARSTICDWMAECATLLTPLVLLMKRFILEGRIIWTDDTTVQVQDKKTKEHYFGRLWQYRGDPLHPYVVFEFTKDRTRDGPNGPAEFLKGFEGYLQADAYSGYDGIYLDSRGTVFEVACWAHARRKVRDAKASDSVIAAEAAARIRLLYDEEDACTEKLKAMKLDPASIEWSDYRRRWRQERSVPLLVEFKPWVDATLPRLLPKSEMAKALRYIHNQWDALCRYTEHGWTTIDNNACEREYHQIDIGRRNWLFFGSHDGGRTAATLFSLIRTCVRLGIEPSAYLRDLYAELPRIRDSRPVTSPEPIDLEPYAPFLPDAWKSARPMTRP